MKQKISFKIISWILIATIILGATTSSIKTSTNNDFEIKKIQTLENAPLVFELEITEKSYRVYELRLLATNTEDEELTLTFFLGIGIHIYDSEDRHDDDTICVFFAGRSQFNQTFEPGEKIELLKTTWHGNTNNFIAFLKYGLALPQGRYFVFGGCGFYQDAFGEHSGTGEKQASIDLPKPKIKSSCIPSVFSKLINILTILE